MTNESLPERAFRVQGIPHAEAIKLTVLKVDETGATAMVPYDPRFIGNPETGVIHGGLVTTMLDNTCGIAVNAKAGPKHAGTIATLDLRIDYMKPAEAGQDIYCHCECYKVTRNIAFVRGTAYHSDPADPVATCTAAIMIGAKSGAGSNMSANLSAKGSK